MIFDVLCLWKLGVDEKISITLPIFCLKCTDLLMDPTHYISGVARTQMTKINHGDDARVNYSSALPNSTISSGRQ